MPVHDWTRVDPGIFHTFHMGWIADLGRALNQDLLPEDYYALPEQLTVGLGPDVVTIAGSRNERDDWAEADLEFYRRKQMPLVIRHVSGDRMVSIIEIVSPANKCSRNALRSFVEKAAELLDQRIHLLILALLPPVRHDPHGIHAAIWDEIDGREYLPPADKPLTLAGYETALTVQAFFRQVAVRDSLPEMPLFLEPNGYVQVPLEGTYQTAFAKMPRRWRRVLEGPA